MLNIKNYTKIYAGDKKACDDVNICVEAGDIFGFIGHNGAGKSTTIRAVVGVLDFTEGEITIDGHSVKTEPMECKKITAYIPDNPDIYENLTGIQYLICRQIIRDHDELNNHKGCRINAEVGENAQGFVLWFTIPAGNKIKSYTC